MTGQVGNPESYLVHKRSPKCPGLVPIDYASSFPYLLGKKNYLGPDEKLYTVGAQVLEEGGGVLRHPVVRPRRKLELFDLTPVSVPHLVQAL